MDELVSTSDFAHYSAQGVFLKEPLGSAKPVPFPCYTLSFTEKMTESAYSSINYPDVLKMIFEAETIIS